jgi:hypothetical protein
VRSSFQRHIIRWITESKSIGRGTGTIIEIIPIKLEVEWVFDKSAIGGSSTPEPKSKIRAKDITYFRSYWEFASFFIGNLVHYKSSASSECFKVMNTRTRVTVHWQNGNIAYHLPSCDLLIPRIVDDSTLWPHDIVWNNIGENVELDKLNDLRYGVVQKLDPINRVVDVRWFNAAMDELGPQETCSIYAISGEPNFNLDLTDRVVIPAHRDHGDMSWFGEVIGISNEGMYSIHLGSGATITVRFDEILPMDPSEEFSDDDDEDDDDISEEEGGETGVAPRSQGESLGETDNRSIRSASSSVTSPERPIETALLSKRVADTPPSFAMIDDADPDLFYYKEPTVRKLSPILICFSD